MVESSVKEDKLYRDKLLGNVEKINIVGSLDPHEVLPEEGISIPQNAMMFPAVHSWWGTWPGDL